jgi:RNA-splicing ligase RtcB
MLSAQERIPVGFASHAQFSPSVRVLLEEISQQHSPSPFLAGLAAKDKACAQLGTLGGGNHFLEV